MGQESVRKPPPKPLVQLVTLGEPRLQVDDGQRVTVVLKPGKPLALITYLACSPHRTARRGHLVDLLWSDRDPEVGNTCLRQALWYLRQRLGADAFATRSGSIVLTSALESDRDAFLQAIQRRDLGDAVGMYDGEFMPGFAAPGGAEFEHWADLERHQLRLAFLRAADSLIHRWIASGKLWEAQRLACRAKDVAPKQERAWRLLIETHLAGNDTAAAEVAAHALEQWLSDEDREPEPGTTSLLNQVRAPPDAASASEARASTDLVAELVGREGEFATILGAWDEARTGCAKHVHLVAPAGIGKTRLLRDVHSRLRAMGVRTAFLKANPGEREIAFSLAGDLAGLLGTLPGAAGVSPASAATLVELHPALSSVFTQTREAKPRFEVLRRRTLAIAEIIEAIADDKPLALLIDDLHWADPSSRQVLGNALQKVSAPVMTVTAARPSADGAVIHSATKEIRLQLLSVDEAATLVETIAPLPEKRWVDGFRQALHRATAGSPLLILETLQLGLEKGWLVHEANGWGCPNQHELFDRLAAGSALRTRVQQLDEPYRRLLLLLALAGTPLSGERLDRLSPHNTHNLLNALEQRGFITQADRHWTPAHDEIASHAVETANPDARRAAHAALGLALAGPNEENEQLIARGARHLARAGAWDDLQRLFRRWVAGPATGARPPLSLGVGQTADRRASSVIAHEATRQITTASSADRGFPAGASHLVGRYRGGVGCRLGRSCMVESHTSITRCGAGGDPAAPIERPDNSDGAPPHRSLEAGKHPRCNENRAPLP